MIELAVTLVGIGFIVAQGAAVFITAWLAMRILKLSSGWWKPALMCISYAAWMLATGVAYTSLGGKWGMMDGGLFILGLFSSAAISSLVFAFSWLIFPMLVRQKQNG